jgi:hypothetical protein
MVREQTLKAVLNIIPRLSEKIVNNELLKYMAKLQTDEEPGIRTVWHLRLIPFILRTLRYASGSSVDTSMTR